MSKSKKNNRVTSTHRGAVMAHLNLKNARERLRQVQREVMTVHRLPHYAPALISGQMSYDDCRQDTAAWIDEIENRGR